jgi:phage gp46-like protein
MSGDFEGDIFLFDTPDGGDIKIEDGLFSSCRSFDTAVYLSLFGGNKEDNGKVKNKNTWWGNLLEDTNENEKMVSRFQAIIAGKPMSTKNIQEAEQAAELDLKWLLDERAAEKVSVTGRGGAVNKFFLHVDISAAGKTLYENTFSIFWKAGIYGGI